MPRGIYALSFELHLSKGSIQIGWFVGTKARAEAATLGVTKS
jgi:hypothetical protein